MKAILASIKIDIKHLVRRKDLYVLLVFLLTILFLLVRQTHFGLEGVNRYLVDLGYTLSMFFSVIITVVFTARQLPREIESKTIYPLLAKPLTRQKVMVMKYAGSYIVSAICFTVFYAVFSVFYFLYTQANPALFFQGYLLGLLLLCLLAAFVLFFSTFMTMGANVSVSLLLYLGLSSYMHTLMDLVLDSSGWFSWAVNIVYYILPHFEFFDMRVRLTHQWDALPGWVMIAIFFYTLVYSFLLVRAGAVIFRRKRL